MPTPNPDRAKALQKILNSLNSRTIMQTGQAQFEKFEAIAKGYHATEVVTPANCATIYAQVEQVQKDLFLTWIALTTWELAHPVLLFPVWSDLQTRQQQILILEEGIQVFLKNTLQPKS